MQLDSCKIVSNASLQSLHSLQSAAQFSFIKMLREALSHPPQPWDTVRTLIMKYTDDPLLRDSLMNMVTLRYRFDHIQYVSTTRAMRTTESRLLQAPNTARALVYLSKIQFALSFFPMAYAPLWKQLGVLFSEWEQYMCRTYDEAFACTVLFAIHIDQ